MSACPLCCSEADLILWQDSFCRVIGVEMPGYPGYCRVILNAHVAEMSDLSENARHHLMQVVFAVERAVRDTLKPVKINLASLGNQVPHLHWHVIPRWPQDPTFPEAIWAPPKRSPAVPEVADPWPLLAQRLEELLSCQ